MSEEQNNGQKTQEQLKQEKIARFNENPDNFIELGELIIAVKMSEQGPMTFVNRKTDGIGFSLDTILASEGRLHRHIDTVITSMQMKQAMKQEQEKRIVTAENKRGFRNFLRGHRR